MGLENVVDASVLFLQVIGRMISECWGTDVEEPMLELRSAFFDKKSMHFVPKYFSHKSARNRSGEDGAG